MDYASQKYSLNSSDMKKAGTGLLIALGGATITYLTELIPNVNWGDYTPLVVAFWAVCINLLRKFFSGHKEAIPAVPPDYLKRVASEALRSGRSDEGAEGAKDERRKNLVEGSGVDKFSSLSSEHPIEDVLSQPYTSAAAQPTLRSKDLVGSQKT